MTEIDSEDSRGFALAANALNRLKRLMKPWVWPVRGFALNTQDGASLAALVDALRKVAPESRELGELYPLYQRMKMERKPLLSSLNSATRHWTKNSKSSSGGNESLGTAAHSALNTETIY